MKERPILFSAPMVRAILEGRKTVTRRLLGPRVGAYANDGAPGVACDLVRLDADGDPCDGAVHCPYGAPGARLWVRETWYYDTELPTETPDAEDLAKYLDFRATHNCGAWEAGCPCTEKLWRPSIFMPRWASRITLGVVSVRAERLHEITEEDARREGLDRNSKDGGITWKYGIADRDGLPGVDDDGLPWREWSTSAREAFAKLWDRINGKRAPWSSNPWVWRVEFRRVS